MRRTIPIKIMINMPSNTTIMTNNNPYMTRTSIMIRIKIMNRTSSMIKITTRINNIMISRTRNITKMRVTTKTINTNKTTIKGMMRISSRSSMNNTNINLSRCSTSPSLSGIRVMWTLWVQSYPKIMNRHNNKKTKVRISCKSPIMINHRSMNRRKKWLNPTMIHVNPSTRRKRLLKSYQLHPIPRDKILM